jgi:AraC family transcriptional regulator
MALASQLLASGPGWRVEDVVCTSGPRDRPFEERHDAVCIAAVISGTFRYRSQVGSAVLAPGALLLGNHHHCFECSHRHGTGDRCLSFRLTPEFWQAVAGAIPGVRALSFSVPCLPPSSRLLSLSAAVEVARGDSDAGAFEELALRLAGIAAGALNEGKSRAPSPSARDERRIGAALRHVEAHAEEPLSLAALAAVAAMSPYHFLRTFRALVGMTPHQFILHARMRRAAVGLRQTSDTVSAIAFASGFGDLSTFNRRFVRIFGVSPSAYRSQ